MPEIERPPAVHVARRAGLWVPVCAYAAAIFVMSSLSQPPQPPAGVGDKGVHVLVYAGLALLVLRALAGARLDRITGGRALLAVGVTVLYGASDEWHQRFVPGRSAELLDLAADAAGALAAVALAAAVSQIRYGRPDDRIGESPGKVGQAS